MIIFVLGIGVATTFFGRDDTCLKVKELNYNDRIACWYEDFEKIVKVRGLDAAFNRLAVLYDREADFRSGCHDITHAIGDTAYFRFKQNKDFKFTEKTSYCGYGFYHGFIEALLYSGESYSAAKEFCEGVNENLTEDIKTPLAVYSCYHGMGHSMFDLHDPSFYGSEENMVSPALAVCEKITQGAEEEKRKQCATGIFNALGIAYSNDYYDLKMSESDPVWYCRNQEALYKKPCYAEVVLAWVYKGLGAADYDFFEAMDFVTSIGDPEGEEIGAFVLASDFTRQHIDSFETLGMGEKCASLEPVMRTWCFKGVVEALMSWSRPGEEYEPILAFCGREGIDNGDKSDCFDYFLPRVGTLYSEEKTKDVCSLVPEEFKNQCT